MWYGHGSRAEFFNLNLRPHCNMGFGGGKGEWLSEERPLSSYILSPWYRSHGIHGVPFDIVNPEENEGKSCVVLWPPSKIKLKVGVKTKAIYFLHALHNARQGGRIIYTLQYSDGQQEQILARSGIEVTDWNNPYLTQKSIPIGSWTGVSVFEWTNPRPNVRIEEMVIEGQGPAVPIILAITLSEIEPFLQEKISASLGVVDHVRVVAPSKVVVGEPFTVHLMVCGRYGENILSYPSPIAVYFSSTDRYAGYQELFFPIRATT